MGEERGQPRFFVDHPRSIWVDSHGDPYVCEVPFAHDKLHK